MVEQVTPTTMTQHLNEEDQRLLQRVQAGLSLVADLHRSDLSIYVPDPYGRVYVYAHAQPHSMASLYEEAQTGRLLSFAQVPLVHKVWWTGHYQKGQRELQGRNAPIVEQGFPIRNADGHILGVLLVETNLMEAHRLKLRSLVFRRSLRWLIAMLTRGALHNVGHISPFSEMDGILLVDSTRTIRYISGRGRGVYRRLGYLGDLVGYPLRQLDTEDNRLVIQAFTVNAPLEVEVEEHGRHLVKSVLPIHAPISLWERAWLRIHEGWRWPPYGRIWQGAFILVRDVTEDRRRAEELRTKSMLLREVHHRVKNNLQTIASLLHMQARRVDNEEARQQLLMAASRVRAVAQIHAFLQYQEGQTLVSMRELCQQVWLQVEQAVVPEEKHITFRIEGPNVRLVGQQATAMALVVNELVLNAIQHGVRDSRGEIVLRITDLGPLARLQVINPHDRLAPDFDLEKSSGLGLKIVQTLVRNELGGDLRLFSDEHGVVAEVTFQKRLQNT
ncbi:MAG: hypothetical protein GXO55_07175 [Chloroflexi bacterium]|nr:hypothetical protein [Chloroflexota bacterium]